MAEIIATFTNIEANITSFVTIGERGYHVSLKDNDCGEFIPLVRICKDKEQAITEAQKIVA
jgi:hypothetical protein